MEFKTQSIFFNYFFIDRNQFEWEVNITLWLIWEFVIIKAKLIDSMAI